MNEKRDKKDNGPRIEADPGAVSLSGPIHKLVSVGELAGFLGVSNKTVARLVRSKQLPAVRIGDVWRFDVMAVRRAIARKAPKSPKSR